MGFRYSAGGPQPPTEVTFDGPSQVGDIVCINVGVFHGLAKVVAIDSMGSGTEDLLIVRDGVRHASLGRDWIRILRSGVSRPTLHDLAVRNKAYDAASPAVHDKLSKCLAEMKQLLDAKSED